MRISTEIMSRPASKQYRDNFDRVFGEKKATKCLGKCSCGDWCAKETGHVPVTHWCEYYIKHIGPFTSRK